MSKMCWMCSLLIFVLENSITTQNNRESTYANKIKVFITTDESVTNSSSLDVTFKTRSIGFTLLFGALLLYLLYTQHFVVQ